MRKARAWFKAKRYGWGWYPATWQGWAVLALYALVVVGATWAMASRPSPDLVYCATMLLGVLATLGLAYIAYRTGEPPRWRWGKDED